MSKFVMNNEFVPLSVYFIETFLKEANGVFVKVYLYGLNLATKGIDMSASQIASELNILESEVISAFDYWKSKGMILEENGIVEFCSKPINIEAIEVDEMNGFTVQASDDEYSKKTYSSVEITNIISQNQSLQDLVLLAQELMGKPLNPQELEILFWLYDSLGFTSEGILLIIEYCVSKDKRNMRYVEKVAMSWHEKGIKSANQIMEYIDDLEKKNTLIYKLQKEMGIGDRILSNAEEDYIKKWIEVYNMPEEMIVYAYECCILNTSKLSLPYIDKILQRWSKENIITKEQALEDNKNHKTGTNNGFNAYDDKFEHNNLEGLTRK